MGPTKGRVAYVTGAASGLGLACCGRFAADGFIVVGSDLAADAPAYFPATATYLQCDVRDDGEQAGAADEIVRRFGRIDVVVACAGISGGGYLHQVRRNRSI